VAELNNDMEEKFEEHIVVEEAPGVLLDPLLGAMLNK
jgi:hypothetical protein